MGEMLMFHCQRRLIEIFHIQVLEHMIAGNITKQSNLVFQSLIQRMFGTAYNDIRLDTHALKFFYACLGRFGLQFS